MKLNWKKGPGYKSIRQLALNEVKHFKLSNGIPVEIVGGGIQPITKVDIVFKGGRHLEHKKLTSRFSTALLREGSMTHTSLEIAESLDYYGVNIKAAANLDYVYLSFSCLNKHFIPVLEIVKEVLLEPRFDERELENYRKKSLDNLMLDLTKNDILSYRELTCQIFGEEHPYGYNTEAQDIMNITVEDLSQFYKDAFVAEHAFVIVTGQPEDNSLYALDKMLSHLPLVGKSYSPTPVNKATDEARKIFKNSKNEYQASIKIGARLGPRNESDYAHLFVTNTILGGYFGSRLMTNIREDQGLTYNIYSTIDNLAYDSYFYIATEVGVSEIDATMLAINREVDLMKTVLVGKDELDMVKNYLMGSFLTLIDGPFMQGSLLRSLAIEGLNMEDFGKFYSTIQHITPEDIIRISNKYFDLSKMYEVVVSV